MGETPTGPRRAAKSRRERFLDVAERRTQHVLDRIQLLGRCANRNIYEYGPEDVDKIFNTIQEQLDFVRAKFTVTKSVEFKLR